MPNQVQCIYFGSDFNHQVDNLPNELKFVYFGAHFNQPINNLPDSVEEIRISQFYNCKINKLPKSLKVFNVIQMTKKIVDFANNIEIYYNKQIDNYYEIYSELELAYPNVKFMF